MQAIFQKKSKKRSKYLKPWAKMYKISKYFEKEQPHASDQLEYALIYIYIHTYMVFITKGFLEVAIESCPERDLKP